MQKRYSLIGAFVMLTVFTSIAIAQVSTYYDLRWWIFHVGGERQSAALRVMRFLPTPL